MLEIASKSIPTQIATAPHIAQDTSNRVRLGPKVRAEVTAEIDRLVYELKTEPNLPRRRAVLKRIGSLAALLAQAFAVIAVALLPTRNSRARGGHNDSPPSPRP